MVATWVLWLFIVGLATGALVTAVALVRSPRRDDDISAAERPTEAAWISAVIERHGGVAPALLVEEVLELHGAYLRQARPPVPPNAEAGAWASVSAPPGTFAPGYTGPGYMSPGYAGEAPPGYPAPGYPTTGFGQPGSPPPGSSVPGSTLPPGVAPPTPAPPTPRTRR